MSEKWDLLSEDEMCMPSAMGPCQLTDYSRASRVRKVVIRLLLMIIRLARSAPHSTNPKY